MATFLLLSVALPVASAVDAIPPPVPPPTFYYYGPVRLCAPGAIYAIDVLEGEAGNTQASRIGVSQERGGFGVTNIPGRGISLIFPDNAETVGTLEVRGAGVAQRIRTRDGKIRYRIESSDNPYSDRIEIGATAFDGSERDREIIDRIRFGEEARAACADVPSTLAATPDRRDELASWLSPKRHRGPLTLCWMGLALDVGSDEIVLLPWRRDFSMAIIEGGNQQVAVTSGLHPVGSAQAWTGFSGAVMDDPRFTTDLWEPQGLIGNVLLPRPAALRVRVMTRTDRDRYGPSGGAHVTFSFAEGPSDSDRAAFVRRLRGQTVNDRCFDPDRPAVG